MRASVSRPYIVSRRKSERQEASDITRVFTCSPHSSLRKRRCRVRARVRAYVRAYETRQRALRRSRAYVRAYNRIRMLVALEGACQRKEMDVRGDFAPDNTAMFDACPRVKTSARKRLCEMWLRHCPRVFSSPARSRWFDE